MAQAPDRGEEQEDEKQHERHVHVAQRGRGNDAVRGVQVVQAHHHRNGEEKGAPRTRELVVGAFLYGDEFLGLEPLLVGDDRHRDRLRRLRLVGSAINRYGALRNARLFDLDALLVEVLDRAGVKRNRRRVVRLQLQVEVGRFLVHQDQLVALFEDRLDDVVGDLVRHVGARDDQVLHRGDLVRLVLPRIRLGRDRVADVKRAVLLVHDVDHFGVIDQLQLGARRGAEIGDGRGRNSADPEVGVELPILDRVGRFAGVEALAPDVFLLIEPRRFENALRHQLGGAVRRAGRHALALSDRQSC